MRKLKLELDGLQVESFETAGAAPDAVGTVRGWQLLTNVGCPPQTGETCQAHVTCAYLSCNATQCESDGANPGTCQFHDTCNVPNCGL